MSAVKEEVYYEAYVETLDEDEQFEYEAIAKEVHKSKPTLDSDHTIIVDEQGNCYYQSSNTMVKMETLAKVSDTPAEKVVAAATSSANTRKINARKTSIRSKLATNTDDKIMKQGEDHAKSADETITQEIVNQEVYEFDENEQNPDDPECVEDPDFNSKLVIKNKQNSGKDQQSFTCMICSYETNRKFLLSRHMKSHSDDRPYKCSVCERGFKSNASLLNHRNIHLGYKPHACSSCDMAFTTSGELLRHVRYRHTHIRPYKCTECDYCSVEMSKLRRHMRCHTGERPYQCPHCTYASPDTFKLKRHIRVHTGEKPYECDICHARFTQSNSLKNHRLIHSVNEKPVFQCHLCPTTCGRKTDLRLHIKKLHSSDNPIPCKRCGKELPDRYSYKLHVKTHDGEKCYRCEYCEYASISRRHLESHVFIHLNAKPFVCEICQSRFRQKSLLVRHNKILHSDNYEPPEPRKKDHKCPHCDKLFAFNGNLIRHMEIHDPTSHLFEEKEKLKMGRMYRVQPNGTFATISDPNTSSQSNLENIEETRNEQMDDEEIEEEYGEEEANENNIEYIYEEDDDEFHASHDEEQYEDIQSIDVKQEKIEATDITQTTTIKPLNINLKIEEHNNSDISLNEVRDNQEFMVIEVLPDDDDEEEETQVVELQEIQLQTAKPIIINKNVNVKSTTKALSDQSIISDYFGFEVNAEDDDEETKEAIKLLEIIDQE